MLILKLILKSEYQFNSITFPSAIAWIWNKRQTPSQCLCHFDRNLYESLKHVTHKTKLIWVNHKLSNTFGLRFKIALKNGYEVYKSMKLGVEQTTFRNCSPANCAWLTPSSANWYSGSIPFSWIKVHNSLWWLMNSRILSFYRWNHKL